MASDAAVPAPLLQGSQTRFLSHQYPIPFAPLSEPLSFEDTTSWPEDPMQVFSQWSVDTPHARVR